MNKIIFFCFTLFGIQVLSAQQDAQFTQSLLNPSIVNPAYVASSNTFKISLLHRTQWINVEGRPITQTISLGSPLKNEQLALGFNVLNDQLGPSNEFYANVDMGYTLYLRDSRQFTFGLKAGAHLLSVDFSKLQIRDENDAELLQNIKGKIIPQFGVGILYQTEKSFIGVSIPDVLESKHVKSNKDLDFIAHERMNLYLTGGVAFDLNDYLKFQPSFQSKLLMGAPLQLDISGNFLWNEKLTIGSSYRLSSAVSGVIAYKLHSDVLIGIAYDYDLTDMSQLSPGSYEFVLKYENGSKRNRRLINPRFF